MEEEIVDRVKSLILWMLLAGSVSFVVLWMGGARFGLDIAEEPALPNASAIGSEDAVGKRAMDLGYDLEKDMPSIDPEVEGAEKLVSPPEGEKADKQVLDGPALL